MTNPTTDEPTTDPKAALSEIADKMRASGAIPAIEPTSEPTDPMRAGLDHLRKEDPDLMKAWSAKPPKEIGGELILVYLDSGEKRIIHQRASGKFTVFAPAS